MPLFTSWNMKPLLDSSPLASFLHLNVHLIYFLFVLSSSFNTAPSHFCRRGLIAGLRERSAPGCRAAERGPTLSFTRVKHGSAMGKLEIFTAGPESRVDLSAPQRGHNDRCLLMAAWVEKEGGQTAGAPVNVKGDHFCHQDVTFLIFFPWFAPFCLYEFVSAVREFICVLLLVTHHGFSM